MRRLFTAAALAAALSVVISAQSAPRLVVLVVVDQMRADYIDRFKGEWTGGLRRLVDGGAWFTRAAYPYLNTFTCAGHATISTGAFPHVHGMMENNWFERDQGVTIPCTDDPTATPVSYGKAAGSHTGPARLRVPTLGDAMRGNGARVVTLAVKARSAMMLAGHGGDAVTWISEKLDAWETSTAYTPSPVPEVQAFVSANPIDADFGKSWTRMLPESRYHGRDDRLGEAAPRGWAATFPHVLTGEPRSTAPNADFYNQWQRSPFADAYVARMAASLAETMHLGRRDATDLLAVSFSSPDSVGHDFGPGSQEIEDMYVRLDGAIGGLLTELDRVVGPGEYVLALTADHGVVELAEQLRQSGKDGGRIDSRAIFNAAEASARSQLGPGQYLAHIVDNEVTFSPGIYERLAAKKGALEAVAAAIEKQPGVHRVFTADQMKTGATARDPELRAAALSYVPGRSGDLTMSPKSGWWYYETGTGHGTATANDQRVPIILFGRGIRPGRYETAASPADVAPTLARMAGVALPQAEGRVLGEALR